MSQELMIAEQNMPAFANRNNMPSTVNAGAVTIEIERAVAEAKGQMQLAKMFPRDLNASHAEFMNACKMGAFANVAFYSVPQGGSKVTGPSIRFAEEIARVFCNFEYGHRELSRVEAGPGPKDFGRSEVEIYAWDKQTNNRQIRQLTVLHVLDTRDGPKKLRDQKDIDNKIANVASKQMRGRILAMMPKWLVEAGLEECRKTISGNNTEPLEVRVRKMTQAFAAFGVTAAHLEAFLGHSLDQVLSDELVNLTGVYNAIKGGEAPSDFFGADQQPEKADAAADLAKSAQAGAAAAAAAPKTTRAPRATAAKKEEAAPVTKEAEPVADAKPDSTEPEKNSTSVEEAEAEVTVDTEQSGEAESNQPDTSPDGQEDDVF